MLLVLVGSGKKKAQVCFRLGTPQRYISTKKFINEIAIGGVAMAWC